MDEFGDFGRKSVILTVAGGQEQNPDAPNFAPSDEKYEIAGRIGAGGMGEVLLVEDRDLHRQVAMKVLRERFAAEGEHRLKFVAEAQATSQLEHPGIPPVHDIGVTPEGRIYFTMKLVRGRTLAEVLKDLLLGARSVKREYTLHKLVTILERVAEALHFAHEKGVIHRDLKPENIMLGEYGEVHVVDWGIAKLVGLPEREVMDDLVETAETSAGIHTLDGTVKGTIPYMSPEQAQGKVAELDPGCDVYALGAILYEMVTLHPAFENEGLATLPLVRRGEFTPVRERNKRRPVPESLANLCERAMALAPTDRPESAAAFQEELRAWLDGRSEALRRHGEAESLAAKGRQAAARFEAMKDEVRAAEELAEAVAKDFKPWQPVREKLPLVDARKRIEKVKSDLALAFAETVKLLEGALLQEEDNATALGALASLWRGRLADAELRNDGADTAYALEMIHRYDDGTLAHVVKGSGAFSLASEPSGAEVTLFRHVEHEGILVPKEERSLGRTPLDPMELPMGSYLVTLRLKGYRDVRYPVHISRNRKWKATVRLRTDEEIGEGFVYVPGGPFIHGEGKKTHEVDVADFAIARYPVTLVEYAEFLDSLTDDDVAEHMPRTQTEGALLVKGKDGRFEPNADLMNAEPHYSRFCRDYGDDFLMRIPVFAVAWSDAIGFCEWKTKVTGMEWRLPREEERAKASRGVDGRTFPWGDLEDSVLAKCRDSRDESTQPEPVGSFPTAVSVYGMGDAAGNMWDWTDSWFDERETLRVARGGSWTNEASNLRCGFRIRIAPKLRSTNLSFRCARSLAP